MIAPTVDGRLTTEYLEHLHSAVNEPANPVKYLSCDPGKANGVCGYDAKLYVVFMMTIDEADMVSFLNQFKCVEKFIIEGYRVFPNKARQHIYSDLLTPRVIGRVETWTELNGVELIKQGSDIKPTAYAWLGQKPLPKSNKKNHQMDAHAHFTYWAVRTNRMDPRRLIKSTGTEQ